MKFEMNPMLRDRHFDERNLKRLLTIFEIEGCSSLEPEYRVGALINGETLLKAIS